MDVQADSIAPILEIIFLAYVHRYLSQSLRHVIILLEGPVEYPQQVAFGVQNYYYTPASGSQIPFFYVQSVVQPSNWFVLILPSKGHSLSIALLECRCQKLLESRTVTRLRSGSVDS